MCLEIEAKHKHNGTNWLGASKTFSRGRNPIQFLKVVTKSINTRLISTYSLTDEKLWAFVCRLYMRQTYIQSVENVVGLSIDIMKSQKKRTKACIFKRG